jgi:mannitol-1-phosphate/altronate dehydrogenase
VIAANQTAKLRVRVAPVVRAYGERFGAAPPGLALALAGALVLARDPADAGRDPEAPAAARHWAAGAGGDGGDVPNGPPAGALGRVAERALADAALWGGSLAGVPGLVPAVAGALAELVGGGARAAVERLAARGAPAPPAP